MTTGLSTAAEPSIGPEADMITSIGFKIAPQADRRHVIDLRDDGDEDDRKARSTVDTTSSSGSTASGGAKRTSRKRGSSSSAGAGSPSASHSAGKSQANIYSFFAPPTG